MPPAGDGKSTSRRMNILPPASSRSPISRSTATPMSPTAGYYDLATFPGRIRTWLRRVEQTPGFVAMDWQAGTEVDDRAGVAAEALTPKRA